MFFENQIYTTSNALMRVGLLSFIIEYLRGQIYYLVIIMYKMLKSKLQFKSQYGEPYFFLVSRSPILKWFVLTFFAISNNDNSDNNK